MKLPQDSFRLRKADGQMSHHGSTLSIWVQVLEFHHGKA